MTARKTSKIVENIEIEEEIMLKGKKIKRERVVKKWNIPKVINSDIGFQLMFGFDPPMSPSKSEAALTEMSINQKI